MNKQHRSQSVLDLIESNYKQMSKGHKAIAGYILNHKQEVTEQTAAGIGLAAGVSESTVVRFAAELGFSGFPEFIHLLRDELKTSMTASQRMKASAKLSASQDILGQVLLQDSERLRKAYDKRDKQSFDTATDLLISASRVFIVGVRSSAPLASFFHFYLNLMLDDVRLVATASGSEMIEQIMSIHEGDAFVGISNPRYSSRSVRTMAFAKEAGATTIAITDGPESPLVKYAAVCLYAQSDMVSFVDALSVTFSTITALLAEIAIRREAILSNRLDRLETIWDEYTVYDKGLSAKPKPFEFTDEDPK